MRLDAQTVPTRRLLLGASSLLIISGALTAALTGATAATRPRSAHADPEPFICAEPMAEPTADRNLNLRAPPPVIPPYRRMPDACVAYASAIRQLAACEIVPHASRDALANAASQLLSAWNSNMRPDARAALTDRCDQGTRSVRVTLALCQTD